MFFLSREWLHSLFVTMLFILSACAPQRPNLTPDQLAARELKLRELLKQSVVELRLGTPDALDRAQASLEIARELHPKDARVLDGLGCVAWRKGNVNLAESFFKKSLEQDQNYSRPWAHLALVAEARGHYNAANGLLRKAIAVNPMNFMARNNRAAFLLKNSTNPRDHSIAYQELMKAYQLSGSDDPIVQANIRRVQIESDR